jgi:precorrin-6A/cobalt-precorrin-6A reductase
VRVLILGGTGEARTLAGRLAARPGLEVVSSLAGRLALPRLPTGQVRVGGFGDVAGLERFLVTERIDRVVDATHPFATRITSHAAAATATAGVPLVVLRRGGWLASPGDRWHRVTSVTAAAAAVARQPEGSSVLLTVGRRDVAAFASDARHRYVVRSIEAPAVALPGRHELVLDRGPFTVEGERGLLQRFRVTLLVTRDSGGDLTAAKLIAARELGVPVVLIERPPPPAGAAIVTTIGDAEAWLTAGQGTPAHAQPS